MVGIRLIKKAGMYSNTSVKNESDLVDPARQQYVDYERRSKRFAQAIVESRKLYGQMTQAQQIDLVKWAYSIPDVRR